MSIGNIIPQEPLKIAQLLILGALGVYFVSRGFKNTKKQQKSVDKGKTASVAPTRDIPASAGTEPTQKELEEKFGASPEVFYDDETQAYMVTDPKNTDRLIRISLDELRILNGGVLPEHGLSEDEGESHAQINQDNESPTEEQQPTLGQQFEIEIGPEDYEGFQDDYAVDFELDARNADIADRETLDLQLQQAFGAGPGPATRQNRTIGAKKAKSLQRRDQRRAYHEYVRDVAAAERAEHEKFEQQYGDLIALEREERAKRNEEADREHKERLRKQKEEEEKLRELKEQMRQRLHELKAGEYLPISDPEEIKIAHGLPDAFVVNNESYVVRLSEDDIQKLAETIKEKGSMSFDEMASTLTSIKN